MLPVTAIWGHLCGFAITATTAIPDAVLTGLAFNNGINLSLYASGIADKISTILGVLDNLCFLAYSDFKEDKLILYPASNYFIN